MSSHNEFKQNIPKQIFFSISILLLALIVRIQGLEHNSVWLDEAWIFNGLFENKKGVFYIAGIYDHFMLLVSKFVNLYSEFNLRFLSALLGGLTSLLVYWFARSFVNAGMAMASAVLVSVSPLLITYSQDYSPYIFSSFFLTLQYFFFIKWVKNFSYKYACFFGVVCLIGVNTRPQLIFFTFVLMLSLLFYKPIITQIKIKSILIVLSILSMSFFSIYHAFINTDTVSGRYLHVVDMDFLLKLYYLIMTSLFNLPNNLSIYSPYSKIAFYYENSELIRLFFCFFFMSALIYFVRKKDRNMIVLGVGILFFTLVTSISIMKSNQFFERYLLIIQPLLVIFLMNFLFQISKNFLIIKISTYMFSIFLISFWVHLSYNSAYDVSWKPIHRDVFQTIKEKSLKNNNSYCVVPHFYEWPIAKYYLNNSADIQLLEKTFDFYKEAKKALSLKNDDYKKLAIKQIIKLKNEKAEQIFIYTRRGRFLIPAIQEELGGLYNESIIHNTPTIVVYEFILKT